ncbi:MAG: cold shock and DUF1294 domain-containing protein [Thauera sp.]|nr:cold shock and DUF1294 domain-containing protein [Thauera sp.]
MRHQGKITTWKDDKGFGFITPNGGGEPVFLHVSSLANRQRRPEGNELVSYELATDAKGRRQAKAVAFVGERAVPPAPAAPGRSALPLLFASGFLAFLGAMAWLGRLPLAVLGLYTAASVVAFLAYGHDKSAAVRDAWRVKENTLHLFALLGGWPGALAAQRLFRHKSSKASFQTTYWITVVLNCAALAWLLSPYGARTLQAMLAAV